MNKKLLFDNFAARAAAVLVDSDEPEVVLKSVQEAYLDFFTLWAKKSVGIDVDKVRVVYWDLWKGFREVDPLTNEEGPEIEGTRSFPQALDFVGAALDAPEIRDQGVVFVFSHTKPVWASNPVNSLAFEHLLKRMNWAYQGPARIVMVGSTGELPSMISNMITTMGVDFPDVSQIRQHLAATTKLPAGEVPPALVDAMRGLSHRQSMLAARQAGTRRSNLDEAVSVITEAKIAMLETTAPFVRFLPVVQEPPPLVGVDGLNVYTKRLKAVVEHPELGVSPGGGIMLLGEPGTGKSTFVRLLSNIMMLPVMIFNFADIMGSLVGQSEGRMKKVIQATNAVGPVIVQMDEIEKQMPSMKGQASDGGLGTRLVGMILPWMQDAFDENRPVIFVATSNMAAIHNLPPEFMSRFMVFKVDEPDTDSLAEIFRVHLARISDKQYDFLSLARALEKSMTGRRPVGRDVVQIIRTAQANAVAERTVNVPEMQDLLSAVKDMRVGMTELDAGGGRKIYAKPVHQKSVLAHLPAKTSLPNAGLLDYSDN